MSTVQAVRGRFIDALRDLIPVPSLHEHQIEAVSRPTLPTKKLVRKRRRRRQTPR